MRKLFATFLLAALLLPFGTKAQILTPVKWTWNAVPLAKGEYKLVFTARIDAKWHTYGINIPDGGPVKTSVTLEKNPLVEAVGKTSERGGKVHEGHDPIFDMQLKYFEEAMICEQVVKIKGDTKLKGVLEFMACDDHQCLPPDAIDFEFDLKMEQGAIKGNDEKTQGLVIPVTGADKQKLDSAIQSVISKELKEDSIEAGVVAVTANGTDNRFGEAQANCGAAAEEDKSLFAIIVLGFLGGLVALVTPCVFPMIPLTVSFFTKRSESKTKGKFEAFFYAFSIVFIYFLLAVPFLLFDISPDTLNEISTGAPLNVFFFFIFLVFAFSFFGFYEIQLPSFIANKADNASNVGGLIGIFFMALTLAIVSFSCTGPIIGSLLVGALSSASGKLNLVAGMTSFGLALALPFGLFALFPNMMKSLPKSGGWLNSVKVVLGFVELIFAIKFLSNADLVAHWGILKRETFLMLWAMLGFAMFLYLIGKLKFPHDSPVGKLSPVRITSAALALIFTVYTSYGILGNDLNLFSGFPPPKFYSLMKTESAIEPIKNDYATALAKAKAEGKPLMIDFTGWACVNCRKMEENVWPDVKVLERLSEKYVIVSLYVDDKQQLPESEQYVSPVTGKKIKTLGNKFSEMQTKYFKANTQPYYVLVSPDEKLLTVPRGYTPDSEEYVSFLDCGLNAYKQVSKQTSLLQ
ncbi:MAG TPA: cytochrome c biogenesis protein CcdA [Chitinophagales bacterium]|nr:cytochrome c biogenesis protein CcdA [Chitinophagales bacterium]